MADARLWQGREWQTKRLVKSSAKVPNPFVPSLAEETARALAEAVASQDKLLKHLVSPEDEPIVFVGRG